MQSRNDGIGVNPPRTIGRIIPYVTSQGSFNIFYRKTSDLYKRSAPWNGAAISEG